MKFNHAVTEPVTLVISEIIHGDKLQAYEDWITGINRAVKQFVGFIGVDVIRPRDHEHLEYVVIVRFDTYQHLKAWQTSLECRHWLKKSWGMLVRETQAQHGNEVEMWFTLAKNPHLQLLKPAYYKLVVMGVLAVYPLVLLVNLVLGPFLADLPYIINVFFSVIAISVLITYPVMPWLTKVLNFWLYPT